MFDPASGLQNNLNRWYDPEVGRWISEDPIGFAAGDANLYRYVSNSPTNYTDPDGLQQEKVHKDFNQPRKGPESLPLSGKKFNFPGIKPLTAPKFLYEFYSSGASENPGVGGFGRPNPKKSDVLVLGGKFLLDIQGQPELQAYFQKVSKRLKTDAGIIQKMSGGCGGTFTDGSNSRADNFGILSDIKNPHVRLALQGFTVYWEARGTVSENGLYKAKVTWTLYDKYDFVVIPFRFTGTPFHITAEWTTSEAGTAPAL